MGSCSSGAKGARNSAITTGTSDLDFKKIGKSFEKLPNYYQNQINQGLKMSDAMQNDIATGRRFKIIDENTFGTRTDKYKLITDVVDGKAVYTLKKKNKILKKNMSKSQAANAMAAIYLKLIK